MAQNKLPSLVVISTVKNIGSALKHNVKKLAKIEKYFEQFSILVFENNSTDSTKKVLSELKQKYSFFNYISNDFSDTEIKQIATAQHKSGTPCRIELISYARNILLKKVKDEYAEYQYTLVIDLDLAFFNPYKIVKIIQKYGKTNFDMISANGLTKKLVYRDAFAFRTLIHPLGPEFIDGYWWSNVVYQIQTRLRGKQLLPVLSAFGGAAIYKTKAYISSEYSALPTPQYALIHSNINFSLVNSTELSQAATLPQPNTNYNKPIICEHVPFHYGMIAQGFTNLFIDPTWKILFF